MRVAFSYRSRSIFMPLSGLLVVFFLVFTPHSWAVIETYQFDTALQEQRYQSFIEELRCPKCQNQNLSGSDSEIAEDLRRQVHQMIMDGKSDTEITQYMLQRYGDFILYRPRFTPGTAVLWLSPLVLLLAGLGIWFSLARRRGSQEPSGGALSEEERQRLAGMIGADQEGRGND